MIKNSRTPTTRRSNRTILAETSALAKSVAIGRAGFVRAEHIKEGATVVDVGINNVSDVSLANELFGEEDIQKRLTAIENRGFTLVGDVNPKEAKEKAGAFTPVPGGVGLLTVAMLMKNTLEAAKARRGVAAASAAGE